jgi:hypothetical protein
MEFNQIYSYQAQDHCFQVSFTIEGGANDGVAHTIGGCAVSPDIALMKAFYEGPVSYIPADNLVGFRAGTCEGEDNCNAADATAASADADADANADAVPDAEFSGANNAPTTKLPVPSETTLEAVEIAGIAICGSLIIVLLVTCFMRKRVGKASAADAQKALKAAGV